MNDDYESKRTIIDVFDMETGDEINAIDFFKKPESEIFQYRRRLQEAIDGYAKPKFVCVYCNQLLRLSGKATERGEVSFFSHLHDSDECEIKTDRENKLTKEQILALKFSKIRESERHKNLKKNIYECLTNHTSVTKGVSKVEIEKRIIGNLPYYNWRQPDISFEYKGKKIVLELQLSTTFLSVVIERDIFYRMNGIFIIWVFNFSDNQQFVNLGNMMCKDIYYSNKRNAFVFDEEAIRLSNERKELILKAIWFEPKIENGRIDLNNSIRKEEYISLSDFKFDDDNYKPYYIDADKLFGDNLNHGLTHRELDENVIKSRLKRQLNRNQAILSPIKSNGNWGFANESGEVIIPAIYAEVLPFKDGVAWVKKTYWGAIDSSGQKVVHFQYRTIRRMEYKDYIIAENRSKLFGLLSSEGFVVLPFEYYEIGDFIDGIAKVNAKGWRKGYIDELGNAITENKSRINENIIKGSQFGLWGLENNEGKVVLPFEFTEIQDFIDGRANAMYKYKYGAINDLGETVIPFEYTTPLKFINNKAITSKNYDKWGVINKDGETIIPFEYDEIREFIDGKAIAAKGGWYGILSETGDVFVPFEYNHIGDFINRKAIVMKGSGYVGRLFGTISEDGSIIIPIEYSKINDFIDGVALVEKNRKFGHINDQGKIIIPVEFETIGEFKNDGAIAQKNYKRGVINKKGETIIPFGDYKIIEYDKGLAVASYNHRYWGAINQKGETIIPFEFDSIKKLSDGKYKVIKERTEGLIDEFGNILTEEVTELGYGLLKGRKFGKWGIESSKGEVIIAFEFDSISSIKIGLIKVQVGKEWRIYKTNGDLFVPFSFSDIDICKVNKIIKAKTDHWGCYDLKGREILPFIYESVTCSDGKIVAIRNGEVHTIKYNVYSERVTARVYSVTDFSVFLRFGSMVGSLRLSSIRNAGKEISHFKQDEEYRVFIESVNEKLNRISFSLIQSSNIKNIKEKHDSSFSAYKIGETFVGVIVNITDFGLFVKINNEVTGLLYRNRKVINKMNLTDIKVNDEITVKIARVDTTLNRLEFTL